METYKSHIHLEDVSRRINLWSRNKGTIKEGFQAIVGSGRPLVIKFNTLAGEKATGDMGTWPFWLGVGYLTRKNRRAPMFILKK